MLNRIKSYMMPIAMITGIIFHRYMDGLGFLTPYLITAMLLVTYCNISIKNIRFSRLHIILLAIQLCASAILYFLLLPVNHILAQAAMICVFAPTATSAPVITGMLGGNVESLTAYSLLSNMAVVIVAPVMFAMVGEVEAVSFTDSLWVVFRRVVVLLFVPLLAAISLKKILPRVHHEIQKRKSLSFYLWSIALTIITGKTVQFIIDQENPNYIVEISIAIASFIICVSLFLIGRAIGRKYDNTIAGGQGLGQKNTVLAIWMAQTFLNPISSIGPGAYVLWQNIVNSYQVWRSRKRLQ